MVEKRGQVAMEFLMTYGWAILIILIAVGALWMLGVFSPSTPSSCSVEAPFSCQDVLIDEAGATLRIALAGGFTGSVSSVKVNGEDCEGLYGAGSIKGGQVSNIRCVKPSLEKGEPVSITFEGMSSKPGGFNKPFEGVATGEVKGAVSPTQTFDPSMVAAYDFEDGANDVGENGNDGVISGADCTISGVVGNACSFDGIDDRIEISASTSLNSWTNKITVSAWVYMSDYGGGDSFNAIAGQREGCGVGNWQLYADGGASNEVYFSFWDTGSANRVCTSGTVLPLNTWKHVAATYDGSKISIYVDGSPAAPCPFTQSMRATSLKTYIGDESCSNDFNGKIDEVVIYNRVLSSEEIKAHAEIK